MQKAQERCDMVLNVHASYMCKKTHMSELGLVMPMAIGAAVGGGGPPSSCASSSSIPTHTQAAKLVKLFFFFLCLACCHQLFIAVDATPRFC